MVPKFFLIMPTLIALTFSVIVTVIGPATIAQNETVPAPSRSTDTKREELRRKAEALSERNAREREEIRKRFNDPAFTAEAMTATVMRELATQDCWADTKLLGRKFGIKKTVTIKYISANAHR